MSSELYERLAQCDAFRIAQPHRSLDEVVRRGLEGTNLGIILLLDGQTMSIEVENGVIASHGEVIAKIPNLDILRSSADLVAHLNATTNLEVVSLDL